MPIASPVSVSVNNQPHIAGRELQLSLALCNMLEVEMPSI